MGYGTLYIGGPGGRHIYIYRMGYRTLNNIEVPGGVYGVGVGIHRTLWWDRGVIDYAEQHIQSRARLSNGFMVYGGSDL